MAEHFDPYLQWLGIRDPERPPNHYRLLGIAPFESDPEVVVNAADRQMSHVRTFQTGVHATQSQRLLNELAAAKLCLLNADKKAAYDVRLRAAELRNTGGMPAVAAPENRVVPSVETPVDVVAAGMSPLFPAVGGAVPELNVAPERPLPEDVLSEEPANLWLPIIALGIIALLLLGIILATIRAKKSREQAAETVEATTTTSSSANAPSSGSKPKAKVQSEPQTTATRAKPKADTATISGTSEKEEPNSLEGHEKSKPKKAILATREPETKERQAEPAKPPEDPRHPVPSADAQAAALKEIRELLKDKYVAAKDREQKRNLARLLAQQAVDTRDNPTARYMLYVEARDAALAVGEVSLLPGIFEALGKEFRLDSRELAVDALVKAAKKPRDAVANQAIGRMALEMAKSSDNQEEYDRARLLGDVARDLARKSHDTPTVKQTTALLKEIEYRKALRDAFVEAEKRLTATPDDAQANYAAARYYCLVKNDWSRGLPVLVKCGDAALQNAAKTELDHEPSTPAEIVALADLWCDARNDIDESGRSLARKRAIYWYQRALRDVGGLTRSKVERRLAELNE